MTINDTWDEIIIGAGSSGAVLAGRLSEHADREVLLIEAGPDFPQHDQIPVALLDARSPVMFGYSWDYAANLRSSCMFHEVLKSICVVSAAHPSDSVAAIRAVMRAPQSMSSSLQQFPYPVGKIVGGSSAINGTLALRAFQEDIDQWSALGNSEWTWTQTLPYFLKIENDRDFPDAQHGQSGPIPISRPKQKNWHELQAAFYLGCKEVGLPEIADFNGPPCAGVGPVPSNSIDSIRVSVASAYLTPSRDRPNLTIQADSAVHRLLFEGKRVVGVELHDKNGQLQRVLGKRVTVCAGAINTVAILLRSGIGNSCVCRALGVEPVVDLPGVGENLSDHPAVIMWMTPKVGVCQDGMPYHQVMARAASKAGKSPDLNLFMLSNVVTAKVPMLSDLLRIPLASGVSVVMTDPVSRGRVVLKDAAPGSKPVIDLNLGVAPEDMQSLMHGVRLAWQIARSQPVANLTQSIFMWNEKTISSDNFLKSAISCFMGSAWHAVGTAKMGPETDPMAVVDQYCRVRGTENLRVVDASVMPLIPKTSTSLTCMMLAERVADWMMAEAA